ncbi:MAG TPA: hypothetical protein VH591_07045 [Ktedonobacterales bacterium]
MKIDGDEPGSKREIDALTAAFFRAVSFEEGAQPTYTDLYDLFIESGHIIKNSGPAPEVFTVRQFVEARQKSADSGEILRFKEAEIAEVTEIFGNVAHRLSIYEKHGVSGEAEIDGRGIISIQFISTPAGWKISAMAWDDERPGLTLPERYR